MEAIKHAYVKARKQDTALITKIAGSASMRAREDALRSGGAG